MFGQIQLLWVKQRAKVLLALALVAAVCLGLLTPAVQKAFATLPQADIELTASGIPASVTAGSFYTYKITVTNNGPDVGTNLFLLVMDNNNGLFNDDGLPLAVTCTSAPVGKSCPHTPVTHPTWAGNLGFDSGPIPRWVYMIYIFDEIHPGDSYEFQVEGIAPVDGNEMRFEAAADVDPHDIDAFFAAKDFEDPDTSNNRIYESVPLLSAGSSNPGGGAIPDNKKLDYSITATDPGDEEKYATVQRAVHLKNLSGVTGNNAVVSAKFTTAPEEVTASCEVVTGGATCPQTSLVSSEDRKNHYLVIPTLPVGSEVKITYTIRHGNSYDTFHSEFSVTAATDQHDTVSSNNSLSFTNNIVSPAPVDLTAQIMVDPIQHMDEKLRFNVVVANAGSTVTHGSTFEVKISNAYFSTNHNFSCTATTGGAQCPTNTEVKYYPFRIIGTLPTLPAGGSVTMSFIGANSRALSGPNKNTNVDLNFTVTPVAGIIDSDPTSNTVQQQVLMRARDIPVETTVTANAAQITLGTPITYKVKYQNIKNYPATVKISDFVRENSSSGRQISRIKYNVRSCQATNAQCPTDIDYNDEQERNFSSRFDIFNATDVTLAPGSALEFTVQVTLFADACVTSTNGDTFTAYAEASNATQFNAGEKRSELQLPVQGFTQCPEADVRVTLQKNKTALAINEELTYTVTWKNHGSNLVTGLNLETDVVNYGSYKYRYEIINCTATGGAVCPGNLPTGPIEITNSKSFQPDSHYLPGNGSIAIKIKLTLLELGDCDSNGYRNVILDAERNIPVGYRDITPGDKIRAREYVRIPAIPCQTIPSAELEVTVDAAATYALDQVVTHTITYENKSSFPVQNVLITAHPEIFGGSSYPQQSIQHRVVACQEYGAVCPANLIYTDWRPGGYGVYFLESTLITMPPNSAIRVQVQTRLVDSWGCVENPEETYLRILGYMKVDTLPGVYYYDQDTDAKYSTGPNLPGCVNVSTSTAVATPNPQPGSPFYIDTVITAQQAGSNIPVEIALPVGGFTVNSQTLTPECHLSGPNPAGAVCPIWTYDSTNHKLKTTLGSFPQDTTYSFRIKGLAGVVPPTTASYIATTRAYSYEIRSAKHPEENRSDATFSLANTQTSARAKITISGILNNAAISGLHITGTMHCLGQGNTPVNLIISSGQVSAESNITNTLWKHDTCTVTLNEPPAPNGYTWEWQQGPAQTHTAITAPVLFEFRLRAKPANIVPPPLPLTGGTSSDSIYLGGGAILLIGVITTGVVLALRRRALV